MATTYTHDVSFFQRQVFRIQRELLAIQPAIVLSHVPSFQEYKRGCRCKGCREANAERCREWRRNTRAWKASRKALQ